jgi:uncharacterized protein
VDDLRFAWSEGKARTNHRKHGVSFEEAQSVFLDDHALLLADPVHSVDEPRYRILGFSDALRVLVVVHTYREAESLIRIISARRATPYERSQYVARHRR